MLELVIGIVLGAAFHEFWKELFDKCRRKINEWSSKHQHKEGEVVEGEVVEDKPPQKEAPAN